MNYERIYSEFIADRLTKQPSSPEYFEKHHILPKSIGGGDCAENIIRLTAEDHIFAHLFLARWLKTRGMWAAIKFIFGQSVRLKKCPTRREIRIAAKAKEKFAERNSGSNNCNYGKPVSEEQKNRLREANLGKVQPLHQIEKARCRMFGNSYAKGFKHSDSTKQKVSIALTGRVHSEDSKNRISAKLTGKSKSEEHKRKLSESKTGKPRTWTATQETRDKLSAAHTGKTVSLATREKQSKARIGLLASDEAKLKMSAARTGEMNPRAKQVLCVSTQELFGCVKDAALKFGIPQPSLRSALNRNNGVAFIGGIEFRKINGLPISNSVRAGAKDKKMA